MNCLNLSVIPQYTGTCWFNAILMVSLYSQYTRKAVIKASKKWNKNDSFLMVLKEILKIYNKEPEKVQKFFQKIKPEKILLKMIKKYNEQLLKDISKYYFKKLGFFYSFGFIGNEYINYFFNFINVKSLDIIYENKKYLLNFDKYCKIKFTSDKQSLEYYSPENINHEIIFNDTNKMIKDIPDILVVYHTNMCFFHNSDIFNNVYNYPNSPYKSSLYNFHISGLDKLNDIITLNGYKYKLDSVLMGNYNLNKDYANHSIAGITCNDEKYVYNGWNKTNTHPFIFNNSYSPCSLMKFDWNIKKDKSFCINQKLCKLDFKINKNDLCYSFNKGSRTLIYARIDNKTIKSYNSSSKNNINLSNLSSLIKNIYNINDMSKEEIINQFKLVGFYDKELENLDIELLRRFYNGLVKKHLK